MRPRINDVIDEEVAELVEKVDDRNPVDEGGLGFDDELGGVPGEHAGVELDIHAENRDRNRDGEFI